MYKILHGMALDYLKENYDYKSTNYFLRPSDNLSLPKPNEEFKCKNRYIHYYQLRFFVIKAAEKQEHNKKICHICHHNFKNISLCNE